MTLFYIISGIALGLFILGGSGFLIIRHYYRIYDAEESLKEDIEEARNKIKSAQRYFQKTYNSDFDHSVYDNIKIKIDFCLKLIDNKDNKEQLKCLNRLYELLYETGYRLKTKFDDVTYITAPLNNFRDELVEDHLDFIKRYSDL